MASTIHRRTKPVEERDIMNPVTTLLALELKLFSERNDQLTAENKQLKTTMSVNKANLEHTKKLALRVQDLMLENKTLAARLDASNVAALERTVEQQKQTIQTLNYNLDICKQRKAILGSVSRVKTIRKAGVGHYIDRLKDNVKAKFENQAKRKLKADYRKQRDENEQKDRDAAREYAFGTNDAGNANESYSTPLLERVTRKPLKGEALHAKSKRDLYRQIKKTTRDWKAILHKFN